MQRYTVFFIIVTAVHVSGVFCAHHQELKNLYTQHLVYVQQVRHTPDAVYTVLELLMMGGENARNMYSSDNNKEY
jgi:hypothetical protein